MNTNTTALQQFRIAAVLAAADGTEVTDSHREAAGLITRLREILADPEAVGNATTAATVAVGDRIRAVLICNGGSATLSEIQRSLSRRNRPHTQRVLDEFVAAGSMMYDAGTRVYRIGS
jgi:hypothetical protein